VPTASGDAVRYVANFYRAYRELDCRPSHLTFFERTPDLRSMILEQNVIYVGGGNTKSMLAVWKEWGFDAILREAWEKGVVLAGISAGAICWFEQGITDSFADELKVINCLGFLKGSCCPHFDGEPERRPSYHKLLLNNRILPGYALDDCAAIHFGGNQIERVVVSRPQAHAFRMHAVNGTVKEQPLNSEILQAPTLG
jgi:peptidase E